MPAAAALVLTASQRHRIKQFARSRTVPHQRVLQAQIVRLAAGGRSNAAIATALHLEVDTVRKWRGGSPPTAGTTCRRCGRPPRFTALQRGEVKALACPFPAT